MAWEDTNPIVSPASEPLQWQNADPILMMAAPRAMRPEEADSLRKAIWAGLESSATGLALARKLPTTMLPEDAPWYHRLAANAAGLALDLPLSIAGGVAGGAVGTAAGPGGTVVGAGAGAFAAPMALREALMTAYGQDTARTWGDVWEIAKAGLTGGGKGAVIGGATLGAGRFVAPFVAGAGVAARVGVPLAAELGTLTTTAAALEGQMPTARDFLDNAILLGGMKGAVHVAGKLRAIYAETGKHPAEVAGRALEDPALAVELTSDAIPPKELQAGQTGEPGYAYHATNAERLLEIAESGEMRTHRPNEFTDQQTWPDGSVAKRAYFGSSPEHLFQFAPEEGKAALIRTKLTPEIRRESTGDLFTTKQIPVERLEYLGRDDVWHPLSDIAGKTSSVAAPMRLPEGFAELAIEQRVQAAIGADPRPELLRTILDEGQRETPKAFAELLAEAPPVKMEYITQPEHLTAFSRAMEPFFRNELEVQTRGEVPAQATIHSAIKKMAGLEPHELGAAEPASVLAARAFTYQQASAHAMRIIKDQAGIPEANRTTTMNLEVYAALERARMSYQHLRGAAAETGRALNILWQLKHRPDIMPEAKVLEASFEKAMRSKSGNQNLTFGELADLAARLKDPAQLAAFAEKVGGATRLEQILEGWKASILSGPQTHLANLMGNIGKLGVEIPERILATSMTALRRTMQSDPMSLAEFKAKAFSPLIGLKMGARDSMVIAWEVLKGRGGEHIEKADVFRQAIPGKAGHWIRLPFRALQAGDVIFRTPAERGRAYELATERALKEGFHPETREFRERVARYADQPELGLEAADAAKVLADIENAGAEAVFAQRLGPKMEQAQAVLQNNPVQFIIPFVRTPVNLLSWSVQHSPFFLLSGRWRADFMAGGARRDTAVARVMVGSALSLLALSLVDDGMLTGGGHFDPEERRTKMAAGWQPYSIKIGDTYYSYQRLEPVGKVLGLVADLMEMKSEEDADFSKQMVASVALFGNATISTTYLSGIAGTFNALTDPARYAESFYEQYAGSLIPKVIGQTAMLADPHKREIDGAIDAIQAQIPFLREKLLPQRDVWGEPRANTWFAGVVPVATSAEATEKVKTEAMRLEFPISDVPKSFIEPGPLKAKDRKIELEGAQRDLMKEVSGKWAMSILVPLVNSPDWNAIPDFGKAEIYKDVLKNARALGREAALPASSEVREQMRQKIINEINRQVQEAERKVK